MESRTFLVYLSDSLIRYLGKSLPNKASRYEAFQYIIGKQKEKIDLDRDGGANVPFLAKVSDLAKRWNWSVLPMTLLSLWWAVVLRWRQH